MLLIEQIGVYLIMLNGTAIDINPLINPYISGYGDGTNDGWYTTHHPEEGVNGTNHTNNYNDKYLVNRSTKNNAPSTWSTTEKKAAIFADSDALRILEKYGWKWNCGGWYGNSSNPGNQDNDIQHFDFKGYSGEPSWNYKDIE